MSVETSTLNIALGAIVALQVWLVREVFSIKTRIEILSSRLERDRNERKQP